MKKTFSLSLFFKFITHYGYYDPLLKLWTHILIAQKYVYPRGEINPKYIENC